MRADVFLVEKGYVESRERARSLILAGRVTFNGAVVKKPSQDVTDEPLICVEKEKYVGRGALKLEAALTAFSVDPTGLTALDVGASTGGFTDCLLQHGAIAVTALDAGCGQLHPSLLADPRVTNIEKFNARELSPEAVGSFPLCVMDVSFISQTLILPRIATVLQPKGSLISLIKPQFEAGRGALNKHGVVTQPRDRVLAVRRVLAAAGEAHLRCTGLMPSPITGGDGNQEFLALFVLDGACCHNADIDVEAAVIKKAVIR